jgi:hypothetical protein
MASQLANTMWNSLKGRPILVLHFVPYVHVICSYKNTLNYSSCFVGPYLSREGATAICCSFPAHGYLEGTLFLAFRARIVASFICYFI